MTKLIESFTDYPMVTGEHDNHEASNMHNYRRYRMGRLKHELWLKNRKNKNKIIIDQYDKFIVDNVKPGRTCIFGSAGYYLEKLIPNLCVIEQWQVVKSFYPKATIIKDRKDIVTFFGEECFDNFIVVNNRGDIWCELSVVENHISHYVKAMKPGCVFFYSFRDTQIVDWNRLTTDHYDYFYNFGKMIEKKYDLNMLWHDIKFVGKEKDGAGNYDFMENPDTTNGNIKFIFQHNEASWTIKE